jgi:hypothetical protein
MINDDDDDGNEAEDDVDYLDDGIVMIMME